MNFLQYVMWLYTFHVQETNIAEANYRGVGTTPATPAMAGPILILGIGYGCQKVGGPAAKKGCGFVKHAAESATR